ncbi:isoleucine--tRNA ligase [Candidatus Mycoplasma haematobovis]|uniref:Isoleucine--tRNA ligase n=1 Tax=Candidatus Mycoplasma haematobovis TaxID=432608 RepID=A0A1A9QDV1_9MOLU|nr:isoleucine--tRNA ligase [Candidatus Mycoplasma haematobovis]OAL10782.1 isoleucine--tRNA ligase [Candidatus Mycoplasma haematobovis]
MKAGLVENAEKFRSFWEEQKVFEKLSNRGGELFILHDGPPYANGDIHLGHALNKILKDFILRYQTLKGLSINYIAGWDTHGLPIENKLERSDNKYKIKSSLEKRVACANYADEQIRKQKEQFKQLNLLTNFKEIYRTKDSLFINAELDIFYAFIEQKLLYWDLKPVAWSWSSKTALAESEIVFQNRECKSIYFTFPLDRFKELPLNTKLVIWTTTPYTLEANRFVALHPDLTYLLITNQKEALLISKARFKVLKELFQNYEITQEYLGSYFLNASYTNPLNNYKGKIINANYITEETGTGIVHIAPAFGLEDYMATGGKELYCPINEDGYFTSEAQFQKIRGVFYENANEIIINELKEYLIKVELITHSVGHDWRTGEPLLYRASPQWFINIKELQKQVQEISFESSPSWISSHLKSLLLSRAEWCLSRQRAWGTPIVILFSEGKPILDIEQIKYTIELLKKHGINTWYEKEASFFLHPKYKELKEITKSQDILDVWFDSGSSWNILNNTADLYLEGFDQLRGWFNSSSIISLAVQKKLPFKKLIAHGFVLDEHGNKMSKSKGNVINPLDIANKYGADVLRLWLAMNNYLEDIKLSESSLESAISLYRKIRNTLFRYSLSVLKDIKVEKLEQLKEEENIYIYALFQEKYKEAIIALDSYHFFKAIKSYLDFLNIYSSWYLEISKDLLYCGDPESIAFKETQYVIYEIFHKSLLLFSIFIPQTAEEAYSYLNKENKKESVALELLEPISESALTINKEWQEFFEIKEAIYAEIEKEKIGGAPETKVFLNRSASTLDYQKYLNVAEIEFDAPELKVVKTSLPKCLRCRRHKSLNNDLCARCSDYLTKYSEKYKELSLNNH